MFIINVDEYNNKCGKMLFNLTKNRLRGGYLYFCAKSGTFVQKNGWIMLLIKIIVYKNDLYYSMLVAFTRNF